VVQRLGEADGSEHPVGIRTIVAELDEDGLLGIVGSGDGHWAIFPAAVPIPCTLYRILDIASSL